MPRPDGYKPVGLTWFGSTFMGPVSFLKIVAPCPPVSFISASGRRGFILAMRDRDRANKNEIEIFVFSVTSNDFPHDMLLLTFVLASSAARAQ